MSDHCQIGKARMKIKNMRQADAAKNQLFKLFGYNMKGRFLLPSNEVFRDHNIYADKSSIVLDWILTEGLERKNFSIREVAKDRNISVGLVHRVFDILVSEGLLHIEGIRTSKKFFLKKPALLLKSWIDHY